MRDADTIVVAPTVQAAAKADWLGYTERHVVTPKTTARLRGRVIRRVLAIGFREDCPGLARVMVEIAATAIGRDDPHITYH